MTNFQEAEEIIKKLNLSPHVEGGYFGEIYRSEEFLSQDSLPDRFDGGRNYLTSIYYMLKGNDVSHFHKLKSDEIWYFHSGSSVIVHKISETGKYEKEIMGINFYNGEKPQAIFKNNTWFAAELLDKESYSLFGCAVAPGFDFSDFKLADRQELISKYPNLEEIITRLT